MPIYEYICCNCDEITEVLQKFSDAPLIICNSCKGELKKLISKNSFHLKGTGWYITDFADKKTEPKSEIKSENKDGAALNNKTDSKTSAVPETTKIL